MQDGGPGEFILEGRFTANYAALVYLVLCEVYKYVYIQGVPKKGEYENSALNQKKKILKSS